MKTTFDFGLGPVEYPRKDTHPLTPHAIEQAIEQERGRLRPHIELTQRELQLLTLGFTAGIQYGLRHSAEVVAKGEVEG